MAVAAADAGGVALHVAHQAAPLVGELAVALEVYLSIITVVVTLVVFAVETLSQEPATALALVVFVVLSIVVDWFWRAVPSLQAKDAAATISQD